MYLRYNIMVNWKIVFSRKRKEKEKEKEKFSEIKRNLFVSTGPVDFCYNIFFLYQIMDKFNITIINNYIYNII